MNKENYKRIIPQRLQFPTQLKFTSSNNGLLQCKGKLVQVIPSLPIKKEDNPPLDFDVYGIGKYKFSLGDADYIIFSFANSQTQKTDCAILEKDELFKRLRPYHFDGDHLNLKLILTDRGLHECYNTGAETFFLGLWADDFRNFTRYYNNWSVFDG